VPEIRVRKYRKRDRDAVLRITRESFGGFCVDSNIEDRFGSVTGTTWQERKCSGIDYDLRHHPKHTLVAEVDGSVVGYVATRAYRNASIGHVANVAVAMDHQGCGIGRMLLQEALDHFRRCGLKYARIETLEQNAKGRKLYPSLGFEEVARQIYYFRQL